MNKYILKLSSRIDFQPTEIQALTKADAIQQLMEIYDSGNLQVEDEAFDLDTLSEEMLTSSYVPMASISPVSTNFDSDIEDDDDDEFPSAGSYVPMSSIRQAQSSSQGSSQSQLDLSGFLNSLSDLISRFRNSTR
jgi:hypothetical protein